MKKLSTLFLLLFLVAFVDTVNAQKVALKNNLLYDAALTPNLGVEIGLGKATTLDISASYNPFRFGNSKMWKHWLVQPEFRIWTCERFNGSFWGIHALGGEFNWSHLKLPFGLSKSLRDHRYEGYFFGGGVSYGHQWILSKHWSIEAVIGVGYVRAYYEKFECGNCGTRLGSDHANYFGPTKASVAFLFFF